MALKILVVDDVSQNITSLTAAIANPEIEFVRALSGQEALSILAHETEFDLALIDVQMPEMDGFELARLMKGVVRTKNIPIIFVTAQVHSHLSEFKGTESGAIDFLFKPVNVKMLQAKIGLFQRLKLKRLRLDEKVKELEAAKKQLQESEARAVSADLLKSTFLANMSHEIRTPISSVIGFAELLKPLVTDRPRENEYVDAILRNGRHLVELVNDILDLSKIEAGQLEIDLANVNLVDLVSEIAMLLTPLANSNHVKLGVKCEESMISCHTDRLRIKQILTNVIGNAIKFSPKGSVEITLMPIPSEKYVTIEIKDSGVGISQGDQPSLFKTFTQFHSNSKFQGTGLGLALSKKLANLLGGDIGLKESKVDHGATFFIRLPYDEVTAEVETSQSRKNDLGADCLSGVKILLADDSPDNRMLIDAALSEYGAQVLAVENGQLALDELEAYKPNLLLLDYKMPVLDGIETTKIARQRDLKLPILLLTANAMRGDRDLAFKAGATDYVSKPVIWPDLLRKIRRAVDLQNP